MKIALTALCAAGAGLVLTFGLFPRPLLSRTQAPVRPATQGSLTAVDSKGQPAGECPLKTTQVQASVTGFLARVTVTQLFQNLSKDKIEAVYTFPLPQNSAVDDMTMVVGARTVKGVIKRREEARAIYEAARDAGHVAGLLDQERPNIFTQSVANIMPGEQVKITIGYVEKLKYEEGNYEFVFPMVVGPRYIPAGVADASRIAPPVTPQGTRAGHDISIELQIDAGVPIDGLVSPSHDVDIVRSGVNSASVHLKDKAVIPNKDFILRYDVAGHKIEDAVLTHKDARGGYFTLFLQPPDKIEIADVSPKEIVFVVDTSGSMEGFPLDKSKEAMKMALEGLYPQDTFNVITFSGDEHILFPAPVPATRANINTAWNFVNGQRGGGGTEMMKAIRAALDPSDKQDHIRIACFMTDGYVGNDNEIIAEVQKHPNARVFAFGIGSAVNRFLLDKMAEYGRGEVAYVSLNEDGSAAAKRFHERIRNPLLTDISIDWNGLPVSQVYPKRIPDLFGAKPVVIDGRYDHAASGVIRLKGKMAGRQIVREIRVNLPDLESKHDVLASFWARTKIDDLMGQNFNGTNPDAANQVAQLGLDYRLMTQYTSFVAVEEMSITDGGKPRTVQVPVEMPAGVSYEGVFGKQEQDSANTAQMASPMAMPESSSVRYKMSPGFSGRAMSAPVPQPLPMQRVRDDKPVSKLDPALTAVLARFKQGGVKDSKVEVRVLLLDQSPAALEELKKLGLEVVAVPKSGKMAIGRIAISKLETLAASKIVRFVSQQT